MRRLRLFLGAAALAALAAVGIAVADLGQSGVNAVSATFSATTVAKAQTRACTGADGAYELTTGTYTGAATSSTPGLAGPAELAVQSVYNTTKKLGWIEGRLKIRGSGDRSYVKLWAVNTNGSLDGFVFGEPGHGRGELLGSLTASFSRTGGFTSGLIGSGSSSNAALIAGKPCVGKPPVSVRLEVHGTIDSLSETSIGVKPFDGSAVQTCAITSASPKTSGLKQGDKVEMRCSLIGTQMTLVKIERKK